MCTTTSKFLLRRTAVRAVSASTSKTFLAKPRSLNTITPSAFRLGKPTWSITSFQRRFASDDVTKTETEEAKTSENFAQTAAEAPVEENLTPAQENGADGANESVTAGGDALASFEAQSRPRRNTEPNKMLYIGNLYYEVTPEQLKKVFSRFGEVESTKVVYDNRGLSRGFGYVEFANMADAQAAIDNLDMQVFEGRNLVVQYHSPKPNQSRGFSGQPNPPSRTLFIGNMSFEMSDKDLNDLFREIRNVLDVRVAIDRRTGQPRGFAHADFVDVASATQAAEILREKECYGRRLRVDFSKSGTAEQRGNRLHPADSTQR